MGCASSSPLINGGGPGGVVESAKEAATKTANDVLHAGEAAIHDVGGHVKEAVQNVTHEIENVLGGGKKSDKSDHINEDDQPTANGHGDEDDDPASNPDYQIIRLKGSKQGSVEETELMENMKNDLMSKAQSVGDDTDRLADDLMKETEDLMRDAETGIAHHEMTTRITSAEDGTIEILNLEGNASSSANHSNDSLHTTSLPEPEIERILADGADAPDSPKATLHSLAVPASEAARAGKDEGMPLVARGEDKPDVQESVWPTPQASLDGESVGSSGGEEHFRNEVLRATSIRTPRGARRSPSTSTRAPPPSTACSERMQRFIFKLNSVILSDIEERVGGSEEGGIVRQLERNPERVVELLSKSSVDSADEADGDADEVTDDTPTGSWRDGAEGKPRATGALRRQHSVSVEGDTNGDSIPELTESVSKRRSRNGSRVEQDEKDENERTSVQLRDIPPAVRLRALMRFKSFDGLGSEESSTERRKARRRMKSLDTIDAEELEDEVEHETAEDGGVEQREGESPPDTFRDVPYDPVEEERICEELLAELRTLEEADRADAKANRNTANAGYDTNDEPGNIDLQAGSGPKTAWEKLQDYLQRVPKRRSSNYDLFYDSDEDILRVLFNHHKAKRLFHYSSSSSSDTL